MWQKHINLAAELCSGLVSIIINYKAQSAPFFSCMFTAVDNLEQKGKNHMPSVTSRDLNLPDFSGPVLKEKLKLWN